MEEPMSREIFRDIWVSLSFERRSEVVQRLNQVLFEIQKGGKLSYDVYNQWSMNIAFDQDKPIQYVYIEGSFKITKKTKPIEIKEIEQKFDELDVDFINVVSNHLSYIHVTDNVDNMLDRSKEMVESPGNIYNFNSITKN